MCVRARARARVRAYIYIYIEHTHEYSSAEQMLQEARVVHLLMTARVVYTQQSGALALCGYMVGVSI